MDDLYKTLRALLSIKIPQSFASIVKDVVSESFDLFSSVSEKADDSNMEDDGRSPDVAVSLLKDPLLTASNTVNREIFIVKKFLSMIGSMN